MEFESVTSLGINTQGKRTLAPSLLGTLLVEKDRVQEIRKVGRPTAINFRKYLDFYDTNFLSLS